MDDGGAFKNGHHIYGFGRYPVYFTDGIQIGISVIRCKFRQDIAGNQFVCVPRPPVEGGNLFRAAYPDEDIGQVKTCAGLTCMGSTVNGVKRFQHFLLRFFDTVVLNGIFQAEGKGIFCSEAFPGNGRCDGFMVCRTVKQCADTVMDE